MNSRPAAGPPPGLDYAGMISDMVTEIRDLRRVNDEMLAEINQLREDTQEIKATITVLVHLIHSNGPPIKQLGEVAREQAQAEERMAHGEHEATVHEATVAREQAQAEERMAHGEHEAMAHAEGISKSSTEDEWQVAPTEDNVVKILQ